MTNASQLIIYQTETGETKLEVRLENETVWLTQKHMAELFQTTPQNITMHLKNIFEEGELEEAATCKDFLQVGKEGERMVERSQKFYNLDAIISVGYRIKSARTKCTGQSPAKQPPKSLPGGPTAANQTWALPVGAVQNPENRMSASPKIISLNPNSPP